MVEVCPCCGNPMPDEGAPGALTPAQRKIYDVIKRAGQAGITCAAITELVYANDSAGGPESNVVSAHVNNMNSRLARFGVRVVGKRGPGGFYILRTLEQVEHAANG